MIVFSPADHRPVTVYPHLQPHCALEVGLTVQSGVKILGGLAEVAHLVMDTGQIEQRVAVMRRKIRRTPKTARCQRVQSAFAQINAKIGKHVLVGGHDALLHSKETFKILQRPFLVAPPETHQAHGKFRTDSLVHFLRRELRA